MSKKIYAVFGTNYESCASNPELGNVKTRIIGYATGDLEEIRERYSHGYLRLEVVPIEVTRVESRELEELCV